MARDLPIEQVMTKNVVALRADQTIQEAARILEEHAISGAPVVDEDGRFIGMLEDEDLISTEANLHVPTAISLLGVDFSLPWENMRFRDEFRRAVSSTVGELMREDFPTVGLEATVEDAATQMRDHDQSRVVVVDGSGIVVGVATRSDLIRAMARGD